MNITKHPSYEAVEAGDFTSMLAPERYGERSSTFNGIISASQSHFWDPFDKRYIDFMQPWDIDRDYLVDPGMSIDLKTAIGTKLDEAGRIKLVNLDAYWVLSSVLHGEQGAFSLSASLCNLFRDPGAQEYAANQAREEARHVAAFTMYVGARWGKPAPASSTLAKVLDEMVSSPLVWKKIVGMQILVEGLAMGAFSMLFNHSRDPVLKRLCQLVMTDEAFHHKFGKLWAESTISNLSPQEHQLIEDWAARIFRGLLYTLVSPRQRAWMYTQVGLDPAWCQEAYAEVVTDAFLRDELAGPSNIFRVLLKTLSKAGIITRRTSRIYSAYVDLAKLASEDDNTPGAPIADEGLKFLQSVNQGRTLERHPDL